MVNVVLERSQGLKNQIADWEVEFVGDSSEVITSVEFVATAYRGDVREDDNAIYAVVSNGVRTEYLIPMDADMDYVQEGGRTRCFTRSRTVHWYNVREILERPQSRTFRGKTTDIDEMSLAEEPVSPVVLQLLREGFNKNYGLSPTVRMEHLYQKPAP